MTYNIVGVFAELARTRVGWTLYQTLPRSGKGLASQTTLGYSPWSSKNSIAQNRLKKIMQVGVDVTCINTNFGGCDLSGFGDIATFKNGHIVHGHQKI